MTILGRLMCRLGWHAGEWRRIVSFSSRGAPYLGVWRICRRCGEYQDRRPPGGMR